MGFYGLLQKIIILAIIGVVAYVFISSDSNPMPLSTPLTVLPSGSIPLSNNVVVPVDNNVMTTAPVVSDSGDSMISSSSSRSSSIPIRYVVQRIDGLKVCHGSDPCDSGNPFPSNDLRVYWQVENGVGCCNTFMCNYDSFKAKCLEPFSLYNYEFDNRMINWAEYDFSEYSYTCSSNTPYNYQFLANVTPGEHTFKLYQKDCERVIDTKTLWFKLIKIDDSTYNVEQRLI
jgi:hypothetical protein